MSKKELTKSVEALPEKSPLDMSFSSETISTNDIIMPKLWAMQGLSELVNDGKAKLGDLVDSLTSEVLGGFSTPVRFVPIDFKKLWYRTRGRELVEVLAVTPDNEHLPFEDAHGIKNSRAMIFYGLIGDSQLPYMINFKGTSFVEGKKLLTMGFVLPQMAKMKPQDFAFNIGTKKESNDKGTYAVYTISKCGASTEAERDLAKIWGHMISASKASRPKVDESEDSKMYVKEDMTF